MHHEITAGDETQVDQLVLEIVKGAGSEAGVKENVITAGLNERFPIRGKDWPAAG
jgi:hypothetical protein